MKDDIRAKLHRLYNLIPKVECKGLCTNECTTLGMFRAEFVQLTRVTGKEPKLDMETERCNYLEAGRCTAYDDRPYVCRAWGAVEDLECYYGCKPAAGLLPAPLQALLLQEIGRLTGSHELVFTATPEMLKTLLLADGVPEDEAEAIAGAVTRKNFQLEIIGR